MKKFYVAIAAFLMMMLLSSTAYASTDKLSKYKDVPINYFDYEIFHLDTIGAIDGYKDKHGDPIFKPYEQVTRGQAAKFISKALNMPMENPQTPTFEDVSRNHTFYKEIETLVAYDIISGYSDGNFGAHDTLSRAQMSKIIANSMRLQNRSDIHFTDVPQKNLFYPYINKLAAVDITTGYPDKTFRPYNNVTRGQLAAFISRGLTNWLQSDQVTFDKGLELGMSQETVIGFEGQPTYRDANTMEYDWVPFADTGASLLLYFDNNKLDHIFIDIHIEGLTFDNSEQFFQDIVNTTYEPKFRTPISVKDKWEGWEGHERLLTKWSLGNSVAYQVEIGEDGTGGYYFASNMFGKIK